MTLEPCKTCGTLNSHEAEICLSCGYPTAGRPRPAVFQWAALVLVAIFTVPLVLSIMGWIKLQLKPQPSPSPPTASRLMSDLIATKSRTL